MFKLFLSCPECLFSLLSKNCSLANIPYILPQPTAPTKGRENSQKFQVQNEH